MTSILLIFCFSEIFLYLFTLFLHFVSFRFVIVYIFVSTVKMLIELGANVNAKASILDGSPPVTVYVRKAKEKEVVETAREEGGGNDRRGS